jgi:hypothetical protein
MTNAIPKNECQRQELLSWLRMIEWNNPVALTLTMKQGLPSDHGSISPMTFDLGMKTIRRYLNKVNRRILGNKAHRFKRSLTMVAVLEYDQTIRYHVHAMIGRPSNMSLHAFMIILRDEWLKLEWSRREMDMVLDVDQGWLEYILKRRTKREGMDAVEIRADPETLSDARHRYDGMQVQMRAASRGLKTVRDSPDVA